MRRILILDDDPPGREAVATVLADEGDTVLTAPDGRTALDMIATATALLDYVGRTTPDSAGHSHERHRPDPVARSLPLLWTTLHFSPNRLISRSCWTPSDG